MKQDFSKRIVIVVDKNSASGNNQVVYDPASPKLRGASRKYFNINKFVTFSYKSFFLDQEILSLNLISYLKKISLEYTVS